MPGCSFVIITIIVFIVALKAKSWDIAIVMFAVLACGVIGGILERRDREKKKNGEL